jgi:hypothetical protein
MYASHHEQIGSRTPLITNKSVHVRLSSRTNRFMYASHHEQIGSRMPLITNKSSKKKFRWQTASRVMNTQAGNMVGDKLGVLAEECQLLCNFCSVHIPARIRCAFSWISLCFVVFYILLNKTPMGKMVSVYEHFGWRTASRNELNSWTEVPLYLDLEAYEKATFHVCL